MKLRSPLGALAIALLAAAPAQAATTTLSTSRAVDRDCTTKVPGKRAGVVRTRFVAPAEGTVTARLTGGSRAGDWDLAAFDSRGRLIAGSGAFAANELVEVHLRPGARITLQACRVSGKGRTARLSTSFEGFDFDALKQTGPTMLVEVPIAGAWQIDVLERQGLDVTHDGEIGRARVMLYGDRDRDILTRTGLGFVVVNPDVKAAERGFRAQDRRAAAKGPSPLPTGRTEYRTFEDVQAELKDMKAQFPDLVQDVTFKTKTFQGRDIQALEIAENAGSEDDTRPVLFLNGIHHAREWPATEVIMEFAWDLLKNHKSDPRLAGVLKNVRVLLQPYTNVDGFIVSRGAPELTDPDSLEGTVYSLATGVVILGGSLNYKRKNCNPYPLVDPSPVCEYKIGTDNNRNYPHTWGGTGASTNPNDQSYRGEGPGSEPETAAVQQAHLGLNAPVFISMHNIAAKVLRPPGTEAEGFSPDEVGLKELGRRIAEPAGYKNEYGWQLYDVTGGTKDWVYAVTGAYGYTIETGPANGDFHGEYQSVVIDQYLGSGERAGRGMREGLIASAEWTTNKEYTSRIAGRAPAGRTLRITKQTMTMTSPVCTIASVSPLRDTPDECIEPGDVIEVPEKIDISTKVPASGRFEWWVNPSTRPYAKAPEAYKLTCEQDGNVVQEMDVVVARGATFTADLPCGGTLPTDTPAGGGTGGATPGIPPGTSKPVTVIKRRLSIRSAKRSGKRVKVALLARGGAVKNIRVTLRKGKRTLGSAKLKSLSGRRTLTLKTRKRLRRGTYTLRATGTGNRAATLRLKVK